MFDPRYEAAAMSHAPNFYTAVRNPKWYDAEKTKITCEVNFKHVGFEEWTPFTADPNDYMPYSKEIFDRAVAGDFGAVEEKTLVVESPLSEEQLAAAQRRIQQILGQTNGAPNQIPGAIL